MLSYNRQFFVSNELNTCGCDIIKTTEWKGQQFCLAVVVPLTCFGYFLFLQMKVNLIFLETSGFTQ